MYTEPEFTRHKAVGGAIIHHRDAVFDPEAQTRWENTEN